MGRGQDSLIVFDLKFHLITDQKFRPGTAYRLLEWNQLDDARKRLLAALQDESELYGIFEPVDRTGGHVAKTAYQEAALLYLHLQQCSTLPHYLSLQDPRQINERIATLVLDGIIEMEWDGKFVSGTGAVSCIYGETMNAWSHLPNYLSELSYNAIYYTWSLQDKDYTSLTSRLYSFNTTPLDASQKTLFYKKHSVTDFIFSQCKEEVKLTMNDNWNLDAAKNTKAWISWNRNHTDENYSETYTVYKLYISPLLDELPGVFAKSLPIITNSQAFSFKVGATLQGLLRPDKMVVYFFSENAMLKTASLIMEKITGHTPQGVPFSFQLDSTGLLSSGEDSLDGGTNNADGESWRAEITSQLARLLVQSATDHLSWNQTLDFIHAMMEQKGIDTRCWNIADRSKR